MIDRSCYLDYELQQLKNNHLNRNYSLFKKKEMRDENILSLFNFNFSFIFNFMPSIEGRCFICKNY